MLGMRTLIFLILFGFVSTSSFAKDPAVDKIIENQGIIWAIDFLSPEKLIFTERGGKIKTYDLKSKKLTEIKNVPEVQTVGQGGLLDVMLDPNFKSNNKIYISYAVEVEGGYTTRVSSAQLENNLLKNITTIFEATPANKNRVHFGSRFATDGKYLFLTIGDRGERDNSQKLSTHLGKLHRIHFDGKVPEDNPFVKTKDAKPEIWTYGHRNAQGLFYDTDTKELWLQEHGPRGGDEINLIEKGKNYGWPVITYGREYYGPKIGTTQKDGLEQPVYHFTPSIAPSGLIIYKGSKHPQWKGSFFSGSLVLTHLNRLYQSDGKYKEERFFKDMGARIRTVSEDDSGNIYFSTDNGTIFRIR